MAIITTTTTVKSEKQLGARALTGTFDWKDVLIPRDAGTGVTKWYYQRRTIYQYALVAGLGLLTFYNSENPRMRAAALGVLFPGAGFIAVGTIWSVLAFIVSTALLPLLLFAWFASGGVSLPLALYLGDILLAAAMAGKPVLELAAPLWVTIVAVGISVITFRTLNANNEARERGKKRNEYLISTVQEIQQQGVSSQAAPGTREMDLDTLRFLQWTLEMGLAPRDDWSYHDVIDQFQTSAIRYQLYGGGWDLALYQSIYAPNFHGYLSLAQRNLIEKSLTKKVMNFWQWESLFGKFKTMDIDPIRKDNIMVSGYILLSCALYQANTGDNRYTKPGSLAFEVTHNDVYKYDIQSVAELVFFNMDQNPYTLYPCEPNWVYAICNLIGVIGLQASDRVLGNKFADRIRERFESALEREFSNADGTILPIRSELTGFTIPGLAGTISDASVCMQGSPYIPAIAHRNWAFIKRENLKYNKDGKLELVGLIGADKLDPGNYKEGVGAIRANLAAVAAEFGDAQIAHDLVKQVDEEYHPVKETKSGSRKNQGLSTILHGSTLRARMSGFQDWSNLVGKGIPEITRSGPILEEVTFPDVLVAKAYSVDGESVDLVLYDGKAPGRFQLGFTQLRPGATYSLGKQTATADEEGHASFELEIRGRTAVKLEPVA
ncbi:hypothetical protein P152DRAFT_121713 [Eremomyces bilateralis CBS 781.70]|uniref:Linalool dehydratase/isomerase domain-containing protein n=1 Tax=Eremomyces bilateralis CBS 781.70 TaxID=1392243 RepID=A0A6G1GEQ6_9PEZI|nr:uncharacterized protein P152DRAFT_121713 [Eremomyces bilateralis CBS 781.70]KAF1816396.1 hypothetical protein P152DRAFT_121713 [Eremomyces bilateralis CBS 781.70]